MCQNGRFIKNVYDGRSYFVNCGHCDACLQEKSNSHIQRINFESAGGKYLPLFVTLSYDNESVPYIYKSNLEKFKADPSINPIIVYRGNQIINTYTYDDICLGKVRFDRDFSTDLKFLRYRLNNGTYGTIIDKVGVLQIRDLQLFIKRLKINLFRSGYTGYFSYYYASEYGEQYHRPHLHLLFFIDKGFLPLFKFAAAKSWQYADLLKWRRQSSNVFRQSIEVAKNPAKYVSSYVNCRSYLPDFYSKFKPFRPFRRFSLHFGCNYSEFALDKILPKVYQGNFTYSAQTFTNGCFTVSEFKYPDYVLSKYWPKFKGYRHLTSNEVILYLQRPSLIFQNKELICNYSDSDLVSIYSQLCSINKKGLSYGYLYYDWLFAYSLVYSLKGSFGIKSSYDDCLCPDDLFYHFDNISDFYVGNIRNDFLMQFDLPKSVIFDANDFPSRVARTQYLDSVFKKSVKHHKVKSHFYEKSSF